jgi:hypothetical protein
MFYLGLHVRAVASTVATVVWNVTTCILIGNTNFSDEIVASVFRFLFSITHYTSITFPVSSVSFIRKVEQALRLYIDIKIMASFPSGHQSYVATDFSYIFT